MVPLAPELRQITAQSRSAGAARISFALRQALCSRDEVLGSYFRPLAALWKSGSVGCAERAAVALSKVRRRVVAGAMAHIARERAHKRAAAGKHPTPWSRIF